MEETKGQPSRLPISLRGKSVDLWDSYYFNNLVSKWTPTEEVWPFVHGDNAIGMFSALSAAYSSYWMRKGLKLTSKARISVYIPAMGIAAFNSILLQKSFITGTIISKAPCDVCVHVRAVVSQVFGGFIIPGAIASLMSFFAADYLLTYPVPPLLKAPRELGQLWLKLVLPNKRVFYAWGAAHAVAAMILTYQKQRCYENLESICYSK